MRSLVGFTHPTGTSPKKIVHCHGALVSRTLVAVIILFTAFGCARAPSGYDTFSLRKGIAHFSFEYPSHYGVNVVETRNDTHHYTNVGLSWKSGTDIRDTWVLIVASRDENPLPKATTVLNSELSDLKETALDFKILSQSMITISSIQAQEVTYSWTIPVPLGFENRATPRPLVTRMIYFDSPGLVWGLHMTYDEARREQSETDFEHILETFKILD